MVGFKKGKRKVQGVPQSQTADQAYLIFVHIPRCRISSYLLLSSWLIALSFFLYCVCFFFFFFLCASQHFAYNNT